MEKVSQSDENCLLAFVKLLINSNYV